MTDEAVHRQDALVVDRDDLLDVHGEIRERLGEVVPPATEPFVSAVCRLDGPALRVLDLEVWIPELLAELALFGRVRAQRLAELPAKRNRSVLAHEAQVEPCHSRVATHGEES